MKVLCTGMSGTGRTGYVRAVEAMARERGKPLRVFDVRDTMFHLAQERGETLEEETILDVFPTALGAYRAAALERITAEVNALPPDTSWILVTHATFSWNYSIVPGLDVYYLNLLQPDVYVTISDGILSIRQRLTDERWKRVTVNNLLWWRDVERASTEMMAAWQRKPHYLIGRRQGPETLYRLMFEGLERTAYLSYPMTHLKGQELLSALEKFRRRLREKVIVFDPAAVDDFTLEPDGAIGYSDGSAEARQIGATLVSNKLEGGSAGGDGGGGGGGGASKNGDGGIVLGQFSGVGGEDAKSGLARDMVLDAREPDEHGDSRPPNPENLDHIDGQIVDRDYKLVAQSENVVVFYPTTTLSAGVICEMKEAIHRGKRVYALWLPDNPPSPFFTRYCTKWFREEDALFEYLESAGVVESGPGAGGARKRPSNGKANGRARTKAEVGAG
jgi:adenylate kinase